MAGRRHVERRALAAELPLDVARRSRVTIAEFLPRQVTHLRRIVAGFPLL